MVTNVFAAMTKDFCDFFFFFFEFRCLDILLLKMSSH